MKFTQTQKDIRKRIIEISYKGRFSHLGSCLSTVDIIYSIFNVKKKNERFVLSNGHAGIALYVILEKHGLLNASDIANMTIHPDRNPALGIDVSTGSLGQGLPIAVGMALADRKKNVYCVSSDGECAEGSIWEALRVAREQEIANLKIVINANGWGAYEKVSLPLLLSRIKGFGYDVVTIDGHNIKEISRALMKTMKDQPLVIFAETTVEQFAFLKGQDAHYYVMNDDDYKLAMETLR